MQQQNLRTLFNGVIILYVSGNIHYRYPTQNSENGNAYSFLNFIAI